MTLNTTIQCHRNLRNARRDNPSLQTFQAPPVTHPLLGRAARPREGSSKLAVPFSLLRRASSATASLTAESLPHQSRSLYLQNEEFPGIKNRLSRRKSFISPNPPQSLYCRWRRFVSFASQLSASYPPKRPKSRTFRQIPLQAFCRFSVSAFFLSSFVPRCALISAAISRILPHPKKKKFADCFHGQRVWGFFRSSRFATLPSPNKTPVITQEHPLFLCDH
jgi:hypothetical protein